MTDNVEYKPVGVSVDGREGKRNGSEGSQSLETRIAKGYAALWIIVAVSALIYSDLLNTCRALEKFSRLWFDAGITCFLISACVMFYLTVWIPKMSTRRINPANYAPRTYKIMIASLAISAACLIVALWPAYGVFTPGLLALLVIASLMISHFIPAL